MSENYTKSFSKGVIGDHLYSALCDRPQYSVQYNYNEKFQCLKEIVGFKVNFLGSHT